MRARGVAALLIVAVGFGLVAVAGFAGTGTPGGTPAAAAFRLEDGSVACNFRDSGELACHALGRDAAVVLEPDGTSRLDDEDGVAWDEDTPVLLPAESWWNGAVSCRVAGRTVRCAAGGGAIAVSPRPS